MSDSFNTYENDFQFALQEAKAKTSQIESVQGGMYQLESGRISPRPCYVARDHFMIEFNILTHLSYRTTSDLPQGNRGRSR